MDFARRPSRLVVWKMFSIQNPRHVNARYRGCTKALPRIRHPSSTTAVGDESQVTTIPKPDWACRHEFLAAQ
jgi:hypothetical protein